ncbi:MAG TPA: ArsR family transcriptional regulator [Haliscomenobacter sp.]|uniref:ArsR family transcriptional regulator n=1 Tax=Haliscomenobacter sp. TaxID=2717303 RepID=UPI001DC93ACA|nr:ArsR family transcriptional regulator [Haliscomenobacter sp.]MBK9487675.1 ArsR family transcriptional regulator [Haliscomenobacter sp.]HOY15840.1 ArsR family transcriptional regulator [Haliscomenobacter sp.]HPH17369.1 ArsR family transcriptional regulator [Haliscomenobacter sp.]
MIEALISSKTRIKLLLKFFLNSSTTAYLRGLESEFGESTNAIRLELNNLEKAGMLVSELSGNKKIFRANTQHPLFREVHTILMKYLGLDQIIENVVKRLGEVEKVFLTGDFARGLDSPIIDLIFIGNVDRHYLIQLIEKVETLVSRRIRFIIYSSTEYPSVIKSYSDVAPLLLWSDLDVSPQTV